MLVNQTTNIEIILLGFGDFREFQVLLFLIFLVIYALAISGNTIIVALVVTNQNLHTPMYFFLGNLSFLEICYVSNIFPQVLSGLLTGDIRISLSRCIGQWYLFGSLEATECCLLCVMSYDRYTAICRPLYYATIMKTQTCVQLAAASWINGFLLVSILLTLILRLTFCSNKEIDHYFCEYFPLLQVSCSDTSVLETARFVITAIFTLPPFLLTLISYAYIIVAVLKIPSATGKQKAFSTCSSHLAVVSIFYGSLMIVYMLPKNEETMQKFSSLLYTALPPLVNPFIYSLRNQEVNGALKNNIGRLLQCRVP